MKEKKEKESAKSVIINSVDRSIDILEYLFRQGNDFILRRFFQQHNPSQLFLFDCENF